MLFAVRPYHGAFGTVFLVLAFATSSVARPQDPTHLQQAEAWARECEQIAREGRELEARQRCVAARALARIGSTNDVRAQDLLRRIADVLTQLDRRLNLITVRAEFIPTVFLNPAPPPRCLQPAGCVFRLGRVAHQERYATPTQSAILLPAGALEVSFASVAVRESLLFDDEKVTEWVLPVFGTRYAIADWIEAGFISGISDGTTSDGLADVKIRIGEQRGVRPALAVDAGVNVPIGHPGDSTDRWDPVFSVIAAHQLRTNLTISYGAGVMTNMGILQEPATVLVAFGQVAANPNPIERMKLWNYSSRIEFPVAGALRGVFELYGADGFSNHVESTAAASIGAIVQHGPVAGRVTFGLANRNRPEDWFVDIGFIVRSAVFSR
jgi:hypothetical protein